MNSSIGRIHGAHHVSTREACRDDELHEEAHTRCTGESNLRHIRAVLVTFDTAAPTYLYLCPGTGGEVASAHSQPR